MHAAREPQRRPRGLAERESSSFAILLERERWPGPADTAAARAPPARRGHRRRRGARRVEVVDGVAVPALERLAGAVSMQRPMALQQQMPEQAEGQQHHHEGEIGEIATDTCDSSRRPARRVAEHVNRPAATAKVLHTHRSSTKVQPGRERGVGGTARTTKSRERSRLTNPRTPKPIVRQDLHRARGGTEAPADAGSRSPGPPPPPRRRAGPGPAVHRRRAAGRRPGGRRLTVPIGDGPQTPSPHGSPRPSASYIRASSPSLASPR